MKAMRFFLPFFFFGILTVLASDQEDLDDEHFEQQLQSDIANGRQNYRTTTTSAKLNGIIGVPVKRLLKEYANRQIVPTQGACKWFGSAPNCMGVCDLGFEHIRSESGAIDFTRIDLPDIVPDNSFGERCLRGKKAFCCKRDTQDHSWAGLWTNAQTNTKMQCQYSYDPPAQRCGAIHCTEGSRSVSCNITGVACNRIRLFGLDGRAFFGYMKIAGQSYYKTAS